MITTESMSNLTVVVLSLFYTISLLYDARLHKTPHQKGAS